MRLGWLRYRRYGWRRYHMGRAANHQQLTGVKEVGILETVCRDDSLKFDAKGLGNRRHTVAILDGVTGFGDLGRRRSLDQHRGQVEASTGDDKNLTDLEHKRFGQEVCANDVRFARL